MKKSNFNFMSFLIYGLIMIIVLGLMLLTYVVFFVGIFEPTSIQFINDIISILYVLIPFVIMLLIFKAQGISSENQQQLVLHQAIGGCIPSDDVDQIVFEEYLKRSDVNGSLTSVLKFSTREKDAQRLVKALGETNFNFDHNVVTQVYICTFLYKEEIYMGRSASLEMAICIAFLKSCNHIDVQDVI